MHLSLHSGPLAGPCAVLGNRATLLPDSKVFLSSYFYYLNSAAETGWFLWISSDAETVQDLPDFHIDPTQRAEHLLNRMVMAMLPTNLNRKQNDRSPV